MCNYLTHNYTGKNMNSFQVSGNIGDDLELQEAGGTPVVNGSIAEDHGYGTNWFDFVAWGETAERMAEHVGKGDGIEIAGTLEEDEYENSGGQTVSTVQVRVGQWSFGVGDSASGDAPDTGSNSSADYEDDAPF